MEPPHWECFRCLRYRLHIQDRWDRSYSGEVVELCREGLSVDPGHHLLVRRLGMLLLESGRPEEAVALLRRTIERYPNHAAAHAALAFVLAEQGDEQLALRTMTRAVQLAPQDGAVVRSMGEMLKLLGRPEEARDYFDQARELDERRALLHERPSGY